MAQYRKKTVVIEAMQYVSTNMDEFLKFAGAWKSDLPRVGWWAVKEDGRFLKYVGPQDFAALYEPA